MAEFMIKPEETRTSILYQAFIRPPL